MSVFDPTNKRDHTKARMFLDEPVTIARFDKMRYPFFDKLTQQQLGFFWRPEEIDVGKDKKDFHDLSEHEQHIFTANLKRQILLDSVQGRSPNIAFLPIVSLPEVETWAFSETIHSRSYTHIIRNVYPDPSLVFDTLLDIGEIVDCAKDISEHYDDLIARNSTLIHPTEEQRHSINHMAYKTVWPGRVYDHKKSLWLCLMSVNILEGIRFYVSFACSWAFAELKKMEGNAKIIKFICRDENLHLAGTQQMLKFLVAEDPDFADIKAETEGICLDMFMDAVDQEKKWAKFLFKDGSMIGLNEQLLSDYIEWIANRRMTTVGLDTPYKGGSNPLPWTAKWISGAEVQVAPQEVELSSYVVGGVKQDVTEDTFKDISL
jgi:ribonucleoside-diphosphate reductase beta chain